MSYDTFKFLENADGKNQALNNINKSLGHVHQYGHISDPNNPYSMGEGTTPGGEAYPGTPIPGTEPAGARRLTFGRVVA